MFGIGVLGSLGRVATGGLFDAADAANGTLVLNFVDPPEITLSLDFTQQVYQVWQDDSSLPGLVGYYQVKG